MFRQRGYRAAERVWWAARSALDLYRRPQLVVAEQSILGSLMQLPSQNPLSVKSSACPKTRIGQG